MGLFGGQQGNQNQNNILVNMYGRNGEYINTISYPLFDNAINAFQRNNPEAVMRQIFSNDGQLNQYVLVISLSPEQNQQLFGMMTRGSYLPLVYIP